VSLFSNPKSLPTRGAFFVEIYRKSALRAAGIGETFVQDNHSRSQRGVLRGLHYQLKQPQGKLVRVSRGRVFDVAVDVRKGSPTFGAWAGVELDDIHHRQLYIPPGFAHGFLVLSEEADFTYKCTQYWCPESEQGIAWDDQTIGAQWPMLQNGIVLSAKDQAIPNLAQQAINLLPEYQHNA
jgi:dTDP-4-dehydrorhamnose 3,5-epimerase